MKNGNCDEDKILDGMFILVQRGDQERIIEFKSHDSIGYGKGNAQQMVQLKNAASMPNYSSFKLKLEVDDNQQNGKGKSTKPKYYLELLDDTEKLPTTTTTVTSGEVTTGRKDNRFIVDDNKAQKLNQAELQELREKGASSSEILETLVSNSASFSQKTDYAQEKYLKKKEKTYGDTLLMCKTSLSTLADYYFKKDPEKILYIRPDTLSQMLSYANIHAQGKYMVYETGCSGLIVAAVLSRLRGSGVLLHVHAGTTPQRQAVNYLNFKQSDLVPLNSLDVFYLVQRQQLSLLVKTQETLQDKESTETSNTTTTTTTTDESDEVPSKKPKLDDEQSEKDKQKKNKNKNKNQPQNSSTPSSSSSYTPAKAPTSVNRLENEASAAMLESTLFSGLIIAGKEHPLTIFQRLMPRLAPSAPFVVYSQTAEPLADCYNWIKERNRAVNVHLLENWFRNIQVETDRTHPEINMSSTGGYILTGISIAS